MKAVIALLIFLGSAASYGQFGPKAELTPTEYLAAGLIVSVGYWLGTLSKAKSKVGLVVVVLLLALSALGAYSYAQYMFVYACQPEGATKAEHAWAGPMWSISSKVSERGRELLKDPDKNAREEFVCVAFGGDTTKVYSGLGTWSSKMSVALLFGTALGLATLVVTRLFTAEEIKQIVDTGKDVKSDSQ